MRQFTNEMFIFNGSTVPQAAFTASATTQLLTSNGHGLQKGDKIFVSSATTLPDGLSASTNYYVINPTTNTFQVSATPNGSAVVLGDAGTGTHTYNLKGRQILVEDYRHIDGALFTSGNANMTVKFQLSFQKDVDFAAAASSTNRWEYVQLKGLNGAITYNGDDGIVMSGTDFTKNFEYNTNGAMWISAQITSWSAGKLSLSITGFNDVD
jgi:hypothetical protein